MWFYKHVNPVLLHIWGPFSIHWYGVMYLIGFILIWFLAQYRAKKNSNLWSNQQINDLLFYAIIGVIVGGRLGYMIFYDFDNFIHAPWTIIQVWNGGMSFHGGLIGVIITLIFFARKNKKSLFVITDFVAPLVPIGLACGRLGNFINGELWGNVTSMPWGIIFPNAGAPPRHPSQLYEFFIEGILLFLLLWFYSKKPKPRMAVSAMFLVGYGIARVICEFFRTPDIQYGYFAFNWLTMGQILSIPMIIIGLILLNMSYYQNNLRGQ